MQPLPTACAPGAATARSVLVLAVLLLAGVLRAQAASYTYLNQPSPYQNGSELTARNLPRLGTTFQVDIPANSASLFGHTAQHYLGTGLSKPNVPDPALGGVVFTSAEFVTISPMWVWMGGVPPTATISIPIPNAPQLLGAQVYQQVLSVYCFQCWGCGPCTASLSRGGHAVIGH